MCNRVERRVSVTVLGEIVYENDKFLGGVELQDQNGRGRRLNITIIFLKERNGNKEKKGQTNRSIQNRQCYFD